MWIETFGGQGSITEHINSFASNGECGLKHQRKEAGSLDGEEFIRQQWRMWIETQLAGNAGEHSHREFIRQQWRMWIETVQGHIAGADSRKIHSPAMANVD